MRNSTPATAMSRPCSSCMRRPPLARFLRLFHVWCFAYHTFSTEFFLELRSGLFCEIISRLKVFERWWNRQFEDLAGSMSSLLSLIAEEIISKLILLPRLLRVITLQTYKKQTTRTNYIRHETATNYLKLLAWGDRDAFAHTLTLSLFTIHSNGNDSINYK